MSQKVLIVEDDSNIAELLHLYLEKEGFETKVAKDGGKGVEYFRSFQPNLVLLDIMLPIMDGWTVLKKIREESAAPVIMLTAKGEVNDRIHGLEMGADDYVPKAFSSRELLARIRAVLRRCAPEQESAPPEKTDGRDILRVRDLTVNNHTKEAFLHGEPLNLTVSEFQILFTLISEPGSVFSREDLLRITAERDFNKYDRSIDVHISSLRRKLREDTGSPQYIRTLRGVGYSLIR